MTLLTGQIIPRQDTAANWTSSNPILALFEAGWETDTGFLKRGDGVNHWNDLPYVGTASGALWGGITGDINDQTDLQNQFDTKANRISELVSGSIPVSGEFGGGNGRDIHAYAITYYLAGLGGFTASATNFLNVALSSTGLQRMVDIYATSSSTIVKVEGTESSLATHPSAPANSLLIGSFTVNDAGLGGSVDLSGYLPKSDKATGSTVVTGANDVTYITPLALKNAKDASGGYVGLTLFKINFKNALNTFTSFFTNSNTAARTYTFQDRNGTIADDTDLAAKQSTSAKDATGGYAGLTIFKINFKNVANTFISFLTNSNTAARTYTFQDRDGTIADLADIAAVSRAQVYFSWDTTSPLDAVSYFIGTSQAGLSTTNVNAPGIAPVTGTIYAAAICTRNNVVNSNEASSFFVSVAGGANQTITTSYVYVNPINAALYTGLSIAVTAGNRLDLSTLTPAWVTNPTNTMGTVVLFIK